MRTELKDRIVLVTGGSSGIGRAAARAVAAEGARVALVGRSAERLATVAEGLPTEALAIAADLTRPGEVERAVAAAEARFGRIDILLPNAGLYIPGDVAEGDPDAWDELLAVNVNSVFRLVRAVLPQMIARRDGHVLVTSSISGHQAIPWEPVYSASKHAIQSFVHGLRRQVAPHGVRVGAIAPGVVLNELWGYRDAAAIDEKVASREGLRSEDVADAMVFMLTRPANVTIRDLVILPQNQDI
ncbi:SDR family oxidoreductase [Prosthecomicrobium pneumaticum]|uniref:Ribitol 2-dehydrogenase n=1 Tax=Prosthecomicrobium pneumaticum TaxID=81895 RepID=A0A7W9CU73_9HYPH|nr:SDR family oxidoreductase [Prosthecomicrobium pneumaticum]MBB5751638.1 ribitol 2-dehydrogenase [Prosthecomicrobium pneumaticum]